MENIERKSTAASLIAPTFSAFQQFPIFLKLMFFSIILLSRKKKTYFASLYRAPKNA